MMAAGRAAEMGATVVLLEKKGKSLFSAFSQFDVQTTIDFFESRGLPIKIEDAKYASPVSDSAADVQQCILL